ncbi:hypothetical protein SAY87_008941 [Trapa incisa]|uniref:Uncharacterized protein n=1 Tax=Trapa incisa TaxID=236973 RepID=A0AAN7JX22_9MYRT|nr:hypothetical protein SAY87_008941 [Trapa incisa]
MEAYTKTSEVVGEATDPLDEVEMLDLNGNVVPISNLWKDRKAEVAFVRHFRCVFSGQTICSQRRTDACGATLVLIGSESVDQDKEARMILTSRESWLLVVHEGSPDKVAPICLLRASAAGSPQVIKTQHKASKM